MSSKIIDDLTHLPNIIAGLGLGIAQAQSKMDLDYLQSLERLVVMAKSLLGGQKASSAGNVPTTEEDQRKLEQFQGVVKDFLTVLAPTRYQFTETTLTVKLELSQHLDVSGSAGLSAGIGAVAINASLAVGYGSDYRGAAECKTVLHAVPTDANTMRTLLDRANQLGTKELSMPQRTQVDSAVQNQASSVFEKMVGYAPATVKDSATASATAATGSENRG
ncbi:MAG TPA: hypothetical protein PKI49_03035 [Pseudomonadota bacterium]|jgi:hypothetical protein|nr:hypothetical protein [Pseudomonadota bacterium]HNI61112.1 hypothetical protein [Pseudomonadota bacterium]HNK43943.1 hypothetical protein [Pseudomonadota bacterium]HNN49996.1 hypothetical protein [Pseudomonadota bacterium]HNO67457.1 hypothetical protein [Pseudomonadota bacterium]